MICLHLEIAEISACASKKKAAYDLPKLGQKRPGRSQDSKF